MKQRESLPSDNDWAEAVASAKHLVQQDEAATREAPLPLGRSFYLGLLGVGVALAVALFSPRLMAPEPVALSSVEQGADLRMEVSVLVEEIEAYKRETGRLPSPAMLAPYLEEGYEYRITDPATHQYLVRRSAGGVTVTYDGSLSLGLWLVLGGVSEGGGAS